jgi:hypothetical protein
MPKSRRAGPVSDTHWRKAPAEQMKHRRNFQQRNPGVKEKINTGTGGAENEQTQNTLHAEQRKFLAPERDRRKWANLRLQEMKINSRPWRPGLWALQENANGAEMKNRNLLLAALQGKTCRQIRGFERTKQQRKNRRGPEPWASAEISASKQGRVVRLERTDPVGSERLHPNEENSNRLNTNCKTRHDFFIETQ